MKERDEENTYRSTITPLYILFTVEIPRAASPDFLICFLGHLVLISALEFPARSSAFEYMFSVYKEVIPTTMNGLSLCMINWGSN